jgi:N-acetylglucosaminyldiphosphoundecaprenol N-acetyl-beta-D-mannosaminyltransferase
VAGSRNGYFPRTDDAEVAAQVAASGADLLFVGTPSPKKELFLMENRSRLDVPFAMGVGGTFDVLAGKVRRAPRPLQRVGLEWAYRLVQEPRRMWKRYLISNGRFVLLLLRARLARHAVSRTA